MTDHQNSSVPHDWKQDQAETSRLAPTRSSAGSASETTADWAKRQGIVCRYPDGADRCPGCVHYQDPTAYPECSYARDGHRDVAQPAIESAVIAAIDPFTRGAFTGWMHKSGDDTITLDEAEDHFSLCMADMMEAAREAASQPSPAATVETKRAPLDLTTTELNQIATEAFGEAAREAAVVQRIKEVCAQVADRAVERFGNNESRASMAEEIAASIRALIPSHSRSSAGSEAVDPVRRAFRNADAQDWEHLSSLLGYGGHGKFWRHVFEEVREALLHTQPQSVLWCCHARGPDDVYAAPDYATALAWSDALNEVNWSKSSKLNIPDPASWDECLVRAAPAPWPYSQEAHAENLPKSVEGFSSPLPRPQSGGK